MNRGFPFGSSVIGRFLAPGIGRFLAPGVVLACVACSSYGGQAERGAEESLSDDEMNASSGGGRTSSSTGGAASTSSGGQSSSGTGGTVYEWMPSTTDAQYPSDLADLSIWRLELPIAEGNDVVRVEWDELFEYEEPPYFFVNDDKTAIVFRAPIDAGTTEGSTYPRAELREMSGSSKAYWSATTGTHTMEITQRITHVPVEKPQIVAGQIHDDDDDVIMIRYEADDAEGLFVEAGGERLGYLDEAYKLGDWFTVRIVVSDGQVSITYKKADGEFGAPLTKSIECLSEALVAGSYCYFKAGAYTQSNLAQGDVAGAYGEVEISSLVVTHE